MKQRNRGFSLVEVLLATAVAGILLTAMTFQIVSLSNIWIHRTSDDYFQEHVDGVASFLNSTLQQAVTTSDVKYTGGGSRMKTGAGANPSQRRQGEQEQQGEDSQPPEEDDNQQGGRRSPAGGGLQLKHPPGYSEVQAPLIYFTMKEPPPVFTLGHLGGAAIEAYMFFEERAGLSVVWRSPLFGDDAFSEEDELRTTLISPYITEVLYCYLDEQTETWDEERELRRENNDYQLPQFIKLVFEHEDQKASRLIYLPKAEQGAPLF